MTQHSIFMEPTAGSPGLCKIREEKWPAEQLLPVTPIAEAFFSLHFGCLASAKIFVSNRGCDFSLDFGPAGIRCAHAHECTGGG